MEKTVKKEKKFISVVVYLHNTSSYFKYFLDTVISACDRYFEQFEIVCVNDACQDDTVETLKK